FAQQRLWFLHQLEPRSPVYNIALPLAIGGDLKPALLARALGEVVRRHEALRTRFAAHQGEPYQVVEEARPLRPQHIDLRALPVAAAGREAERLARAAARQPFDLARLPVLRLALVERAAGEWLALLAIHHIAADGWSLGILVREVTALYAAFAAGEPS